MNSIYIVINQNSAYSIESIDHVFFDKDSANIFAVEERLLPYLKSIHDSSVEFKDMISLVNEHANCLQFSFALTCWEGRCQELKNKYMYHWSVISRVVKDFESTPVNVKQFVASKPGANCRVCPNKDYNEYAMADQSDGTYVCKSCKMLQSVF